MPKGLFADASPFVQLIMLAFIMLACFLFFMVIGVLLAPFILGVSLTELLGFSNGDDPVQNLNLMRYLQVLQGIGLFIIPAFLAAYLFSRKPIHYLNLRRNPNGEALNEVKPKTRSSNWFLLTLLLMFFAMPFINLLVALNEMIVFPEILSGLEQWLRDFEEIARQTVELFLKVDTAGGLFFNIFMIAVLPALGEELIFRGLLQKNLVRWTGSVHAGVIISGFLFSMMHMQFYGFFPRWLLGIMFGYMLVWSGTMWLPIFAHFVNNAVAVFLYYLIHKGVISESIEEFGSTGSDIPVTILTTIICVWIFWTMYRKRIMAPVEKQNETLVSNLM